MFAENIYLTLFQYLFSVVEMFAGCKETERGEEAGVECSL